MSNQGPGAPPGWKRSPSGHLFRQKNDGSWWWRASDQRWYPEAQHPSYRQPVAPPLPAPVAPPPVATPPGPLSVDRPTPVFDPGSARRRGRPAPPIPPAPTPLDRPAPVSTAPLPQRAWRAFRGWPTSVQVALWIIIVLVVIGALGSQDDKPTVVASGPSTTARTTPAKLTTTTGLVLPKAVTTTVLRPTPTTVTQRATPARGPAGTTTPATDPPATDPPTTDPPVTDPPFTDPPVTDPLPDCSESYPGVCIPPSPPDLNCGDISFRRFTVLPPDPHHFDGPPADGIGCESD